MTKRESSAYRGTRRALLLALLAPHILSAWANDEGARRRHTVDEPLSFRNVSNDASAEKFFAQERLQTPLTTVESEVVRGVLRGESGAGLLFPTKGEAVAGGNMHDEDADAAFAEPALTEVEGEVVTGILQEEVQDEPVRAEVRPIREKTTREEEGKNTGGDSSGGLSEPLMGESAWAVPAREAQGTGAEEAPSQPASLDTPARPSGGAWARRVSGRTIDKPASHVESETTTGSLHGLRLSQLQKRAAAEGVDLVKIFDAVDSDAPHEALAALITGAAATAAEAQQHRHDSERSDTGGHKIGSRLAADTGTKRAPSGVRDVGAATAGVRTASSAGSTKAGHTPEQAVSPRRLQNWNPTDTTTQCTVGGHCSGHAVLVSTEWNVTTGARSCTCVCSSGYSGSDCSVIDTDCHGDWSACNANCGRNFTAITDAAGQGAPCPTNFTLAVIAGSALPCAAGDGACPATPDGRAAAKISSLQQLFNASATGAAESVATKRAIALARVAAAANKLGASRIETDASRDVSAALRAQKQAVLDALLNSTEAQLNTSDATISNLQAVSIEQHVSHMAATEREYQNSLSVVCNSTIGICAYDDVRNPAYPAQNTDTAYASSSGGSGMRRLQQPTRDTAPTAAQHPNLAYTTDSRSATVSDVTLIDDQPQRQGRLTTLDEPAMIRMADADANAEQEELHRLQDRVVGTF